MLELARKVNPSFVNLRLYSVEDPPKVKWYNFGQYLAIEWRLAFPNWDAFNSLSLVTFLNWWRMTLRDWSSMGVLSKTNSETLEAIRTRALSSVSSKCFFLLVTFDSSSLVRCSNLLVNTLENSILMLHTCNIPKESGKHIRRLILINCY